MRITSLSFSQSIASIRWFRHRSAGEALGLLQKMAQTGDYTLNQLEAIRLNTELRKDRELTYSLSSLYLQLGQIETVDDLLRGHSPGAEMKRYFSVLRYSANQCLPMPQLSRRQELALGNIDDRLRGQQGLIHRVEQAGGFSVVGNAPTTVVLSARDDLCTFYFNAYGRNPGINGVASVHVVSPSWKNFADIESDAVLLSGNSIFHRRSKVWERFAQIGCINSIYLAPREVWVTLYSTLGGSPTAGLLVLSWLSTLLRSGNLNASNLDGHVAGFSLQTPAVNHSFNSDSLSARHNWALEPQLVEQTLYRLRHRIDNFQCASLSESVRRAA